MMDRTDSTDSTSSVTAVRVVSHAFDDSGVQFRREVHRLPLGPTAVWGLANREEDPGDLRMPWTQTDLGAPSRNVHHKVISAKVLPGGLLLTATRAYRYGDPSSFRVLVQNRPLPRVGDESTDTFSFGDHPEIVVQLSYRFSAPDSLRRVELRFTPLRASMPRNSEPVPPADAQAQARALLRDSWWLHARSSGALEIYALICRAIVDRGDAPATAAWHADVQAELSTRYGSEGRSGKLKGAAGSFLRNSTDPWRQARKILSLDDAFLDPVETSAGAVGHRIDATWESAFTLCGALLEARVVLPEDLADVGMPGPRSRR
ncbi:hypothetical protein [Rathayibacter sp. VKM Ac-2927]|uniref:hypothetical protein n=1 Tax=Rathayibacter sp. VKM Ac-2927 TaxID=2929478 RepID=UPI001FB2E3E2|nr:hypothetical protein [Rathayibacter sp. VKM Ac-2927]MCJ1688145.1 hypothetical protein [Rathayibacter sp. VKM Ac-2927]